MHGQRHKKYHYVLQLISRHLSSTQTLADNNDRSYTNQSSWVKCTCHHRDEMQTCAWVCYRGRGFLNLNKISLIVKQDNSRQLVFSCPVTQCSMYTFGMQHMYFLRPWRRKEEEDFKELIASLNSLKWKGIHDKYIETHILSHLNLTLKISGAFYYWDHAKMHIKTWSIC
jgi:hypothetical protein